MHALRATVRLAAAGEPEVPFWFSLLGLVLSGLLLRSFGDAAALLMLLAG